MSLSIYGSIKREIENSATRASTFALSPLELLLGRLVKSNLAPNSYCYHLSLLKKYIESGIPYISLFGERRIRFIDQCGGTKKTTEVSLNELGRDIRLLVNYFICSSHYKKAAQCAESIRMRLILAELSATFAEQLERTHLLMKCRNLMIQWISLMFYAVHEKVLFSFSFNERQITSNLPVDEEITKEKRNMEQEQSKMCYADIALRSFSSEQITQLELSSEPQETSYYTASLEREQGYSWGTIIWEGRQTLTRASLEERVKNPLPQWEESGHVSFTPTTWLFT
jgi:hypothetical protein